MILAATMGMSSPAEDAVARFRQGDRAALGVILPEYQFRLYRFLLRMVRERAADGCAVLIVTHSAEAVRIADRVIALADGRAQETREVSDVRH